ELTQAAAGELGLTVQRFEARLLDELEPTLDAMAYRRTGIRFPPKSRCAVRYAAATLNFCIRVSMPRAPTTRHMASSAPLIAVSTPGIPKFANSGTMSSGTIMLALRPTALQMPTPLSRNAVGNSSGTYTAKRTATSM